MGSWVMDQYRKKRFPEMPSLDEFEASNIGVYAVPVQNRRLPLPIFALIPSHPLNTPSGKIEIFSKQLFDLGQPEEIPAVPKYIQEWESPFGPEANGVPAAGIGTSLHGAGALDPRQCRLV